MLLSVAILSYNRPTELLRSLQSLVPLPDGVEVIIFDDASPRIEEIVESIENFIDINNGFKLVINKHNLGYDANLLNAVISASGDYVFLLSDDDFLEKGALLNVLRSLMSSPHPLSFVRFCEKYPGNLWMPPALGSGRRDFGRSLLFKSDNLFNNGSFIYNSILFSGLIFQKSQVFLIKDRLAPYLNSIYIQVAIFALLADKFGAQFIAGPGIVACADGQNGFGTNPNSIDESDLIDRSCIHSNLKFNRRLIKVINLISSQIGLNFETAFFSEFNYRNFSGMRFARNMSRSNLVSYWNDLSEITKNRHIYHYFIFYLMWLLPNIVVKHSSNLFFRFSNFIKPGR
jgi:glycosyltransferase involved in cell wall biosynthesis